MASGLLRLVAARGTWATSRLGSGRSSAVVAAAAAAVPGSVARLGQACAHFSTTPLPGMAKGLREETFLNAQSGSYLADMYEAWLQDPKSVHVSWQIYFRNVTQGGKEGLPTFSIPPATTTTTPSLGGGGGELGVPHQQLGYDGAAVIGVGPGTEGEPTIPANQIKDHMKVQLMVRAHQVRGHHLAKLDPLGIKMAGAVSAPELDYRHYGFQEADLDWQFFLGSGILPSFLGNGTGAKSLTLREIIASLEQVYCGSIGIEYGHISDRIACDWIRQRFEVPRKYNYSREKKKLILDRLMWSDHFERFVASKYPSEKRFGLEGCESLIPGMKGLIDSSVELGINSVVMGMPHRGRLNVLSNVVRKPNASIFSEFSGSMEAAVEGSGDVKYHLGMNYVRPTPSGKLVHLSLAANPSHLEAVNPVVQGKVRGIQHQTDDADRSKAMAILLHGDAAFAAQGVVYESLGMVDLPAYTTGGSVHVIVNNQVGFTTDPRFARSTPYCSDVAKTVDAPILHVNADDTEAVVFAMEFAAEWRAKFKKDVVVDLVCYRKYGHNEIDQPGFTQPLMYERIGSMVPVLEKYSQQLIAEGSITADEVAAMKQKVWNQLEENYVSSKTYKPTSKEWVSSTWTGFKSPLELATEVVVPENTGVEPHLLKHIGTAACTYPTDFTVHPNLGKILKARERSIAQGQGIDWATAESLAFGTLLGEGNHVRLSGQDVERGTFSQRHALLHDQQTERQYVPLSNIVGGKVTAQSKFTVCNSSLSEFGTLGFELGYSLVAPNQLILWEAQFGDFANNAQCIIDQFISSGEQKWLQRTGLTMLLPHGYDGQGPEHSSARIERFLALCDEAPDCMPPLNSTARGSASRQHQDCNMQVAYPTVPSNYFHLLRRQVHREFRKPLIVFTSKALLRHPMAKSSMAEMVDGTRFQRLIPEVLHPNPLSELDAQGDGQDGPLKWAGITTEPRLPLALVTDPASPPTLPASMPSTGTPAAEAADFTLLPPAEIKTLIFCSGQVYYLLNRTRRLNQLRHVAIVRLEQLNPFPFWEAKTVIDYYGRQPGSALEEIVYCQEESWNSGSWSFVEPRLGTVVRHTDWFQSAKGKAWQDRLDAQRVGGGLSNGRSANEADRTSVRGGRLVRYAGRDISAAPATGIKKQHAFEEKMLLSEALFGGALRSPVAMENGIPKF